MQFGSILILFCILAFFKVRLYSLRKNLISEKISYQMLLIRKKMLTLCNFLIKLNVKR